MIQNECNLLDDYSLDVSTTIIHSRKYNILTSETALPILIVISILHSMFKFINLMILFLYMIIAVTINEVAD